MRARSHSGRGSGVRACPLAFWARELSEVSSARGRSHSGRGGAVRACSLALWARELSEVSSARARSHSGRGGAIRASPLTFWAREVSEVPSAGARSLYGHRGGFRASPIAFCAREPFSASNCQQSLVSRKSSFRNTTPLLQDAKKHLFTSGWIGGSPSSTNVMCLDVKGRDRWDRVGTKFRRVSNFPPQGGGGN